MKAASGSTASASALAAGPPAKFAAVIDKLPAKSIEAAQKICEDLVAAGPSVVAELVKGVGDKFGDPDGVKPKYALHGMVCYASRPGADDERKMVAESLAAELGSEHSDELKAFLLRQLQWCGRVEEVPAIAALLPSERLCEPATQALLSIGGGKATAALRQALDAAKGSRRVTIVRALGRLRDGRSSGAIRTDAGSERRDLRLVALYALANMPDPEALDIELEAAGAKSRFERAQAVDSALLLARRLAGEGRKEEAVNVCRHFLSTRKAPEELHDRCAALHDLAMIAGAGAVEDVLKALRSKEVKYRVPAARTAVKLARSIRKHHRAAAEKLLKNVLKATEEKSVLQEAKMVL